MTDGAPWIWERIRLIKRLAKLDGVKAHEILDCCHSAHHLAGALKALGLDDTARLHRTQWTLLRNGQWRQLVRELTGPAADFVGDAAPNLRCRPRRLPREARHRWSPELSAIQESGSAAGERSHRKQHPPSDQRALQKQLDELPSAESLLQLRSQLLTNRWDECLCAACDRDWLPTPWDILGSRSVCSGIT